MSTRSSGIGRLKRVLSAVLAGTVGAAALGVAPAAPVHAATRPQTEAVNLDRTGGTATVFTQSFMFEQFHPGWERSRPQS